MLAKLTSKNQLTLPKAVVREFPGTRYFEVRAEKGRIVLSQTEPLNATPPSDERGRRQQR